METDSEKPTNFVAVGLVIAVLAIAAVGGIVVLNPKSTTTSESQPTELTQSFATSTYQSATSLAASSVSSSSSAFTEDQSPTIVSSVSTSYTSTLEPSSSSSISTSVITSIISTSQITLSMTSFTSQLFSSTSQISISSTSSSQLFSTTTSSTQSTTTSNAPYAICSLVSTTTKVPTNASTVAVSVVDEDFVPSAVTVVIGVNNTVVWTNLGSEVHTVTSTDGAFDSGSLNTGQSFMCTFTQPMIVAYFCEIHPQMTGIIQVKVNTT